MRKRRWVTLFVSFAAFLVLLNCSAAVLLLRALPSPDAFLDQSRRIELGMTLADVESVFGRPADSREEHSPVRPVPGGATAGFTADWEDRANNDPTARISVDFGPDGRVVWMRQFASGQGGWLQGVARSLGF